jgi:hypothetical protein
MAHEDDRLNSENVNIMPYNLEQHGYSVTSLQSNYFSIFLSYADHHPANPLLEYFELNVAPIEVISD